MSDDMLVHFASNSSNQSDQSLPTKMAKLEARMAGKASSAVSQQPGWPSVSSSAGKFGGPAEEIVKPSPSSSDSDDDSLPTKIAKLEARMVGKASSAASQQPGRPSVSSSAGKFGGPAEEIVEPSSTSSDSDDDNGGEFLIQANTRKRLKVQEDVNEALTDGRQTSLEAVETKNNIDANRKKSGRGRGGSGSGRGRGSKSNDHTRTQNSHPTSDASHKDGRLKDQFHSDNSASLKEEIVSLRAKVAVLEEDLLKAKQEISEHKNLCPQIEKELRELKDLEQQMKPKRTKIISDLLISVSKAERQEARLKVRQDSLRLGNVGVSRAGTVLTESWEDGQELKDIVAQLKQLTDKREAIMRQRKLFKEKQSDKGDGINAEAGLLEDVLIQDEIYKARLANIKREEESILREKERYDLDKGRLIREMKRIRDEDGSRFNSFQILHHRYALLNLLGKGGFSEVYKAFDLVDHRYVACKLHGLNAQWSEEKKQSYIRHAIREYNIHKTLVHPHIVRLWDIFEIDHNTFCTVLEYCSGKDLDAVLKTTSTLPEKEARVILVQIFQGLIYMNKRTLKIIHYDLKPGNVLFDELGSAKVTDFGLSKIMENDVGSQGMELTSQGAGTYWYLPPECFELNKTPLISSKVDVWSAGVLFYQMLFGRRPFGHDQSQEKILREDTIINARKVEFPSKPTVSSEAKEFIRRCLTYNQNDRPDVLTLAQDPYLTYSKKQ
ncbi:serine/threonine-protein kinase TOUSLED isoform X1 [Vicia villosa]|uniref:serine/threonine-protein kinase TOUSLED isoform X1 n=1 Tax=Vicia villosa TaxID=3911 RepID=UPI00273B00C9|nr:serine/threonine-protein kinase TOUSLED isoform X1 [Vicia villosa]